MRLELVAWKSAHLFDSGSPDGKQFFRQHSRSAPSTQPTAFFAAAVLDSAADCPRCARARFSSAASVLPSLRTLLFAVFPSTVLPLSSRDSWTWGFAGPNDFLCILLMGFLVLANPRSETQDGRRGVSPYWNYNRLELSWRRTPTTAYDFQILHQLHDLPRAQQTD